LAETLIGMSENGQQSEALEVIAHERKTTLGQLRRLFQMARVQIKDNIRPVIIYITEDGQTPILGLLVDQVNDVVTYDETTLLDIESSNLNRIHDIELSSTLLKGFVRDNEGGECFLLRPTKLLELKNENKESSPLEQSA
jgi:chemotaxis signal transduction protein